MSPNVSISSDKLSLVKSLYFTKQYSMREIGETLNVSLDAVTSFFRRHRIQRRSFQEIQRLRFEKKKPSFTKNRLKTAKLKELSAIGAMLYWAEGYKGNQKTSLVDFANSDPKMIKIFLIFLRSVYILDESKFRIYLYCYSNQDIKSLMNFWSKETSIPKSQITKPYIRSDFRENGRKMKYGMIHIRYHDKKLLLDIKSMIESYVQKYA